MTDLHFDGVKFDLRGSGHVSLRQQPITPGLLVALLDEPVDSTFFLPDLMDMLEEEARHQLRVAFEAAEDPEVAARYKSLAQRFVGMQPKQTWDITELHPVWRTKLEGALIDEIIRVKDGRAFVVIAGSKEIISEHDLYRRTLKTIGDHLDSIAADAATIAKYTKATLQSPIVERKICVQTAAGISTISAWGPACLDASQWELPAGVHFLTLDT